MPHEIEAKVKVTPEEVKRVAETLRKQGSGFTYVQETNTYFDAKGRKLDKADKALRIRVSRNLDGLRSDSVYVTFKGPLVKGKFKSREEVESYLPSVGSNDIKSLVSILGAIGYKPTFTYQKKRQAYHLLLNDYADSAELVIDEIPQLGFFIEVEAENEANIEQVLHSVGLDGKKPIKDGYPKLIKKYAEKHPVPDKWEFPK